VSAPGRSGILVVDKDVGPTSFDVVALVRRELGVRRVGHAGTLDPEASGVLPVLVGEATKLTPYLVDQDKAYRATVRFGVTTDTHDLTGRVLAERPVTGLSPARVEAACGPFVGLVQQTPPMYSAVHHAGRRLYELAREGIEVARAPRTVLVRSITVEAVDGPRATLTIVCGKGTYVRVLAADIGEALGCGGAVERLVRTRVGPFGLDGAVPSGAIRGAGGALWDRLLPPEAALAGWPRVSVDRRGEAVFTHGQAADVHPPVAPGRGLVSVHDGAGVLLGVGELAGDGSKVQPVRLLHADDPGTRVLPA